MKKICSFMIALIVFCGCISFTTYAYGENDNLENVVEDEKENDENNNILAEDIEITSYSETMNVGENQTISASVLPANAQDTVIKYSSDNEAVATVTSGGIVLAQGKGTTTIRLKSGNIVKELPLKVKVDTKIINLNRSYITLKIGEQFKVVGQVLPAEADQSLVYKSINNVVSVNNEGLVTALKNGTSSVIVSNEDLKSVLTVIVNDNSSSEANNISGTDISQGDNYSSDDNNDEEIVIDADDMEKVSKELLMKIAGTNKKLIINKDRYKISIYGKDIVNPENEIMLNINFDKTETGICFFIEDKLPGKIYIDILDYSSEEYKYRYILDKSLNKYKMLNVEKSEDGLEIETSGRYMISDKKINNLNINKYAVIGGAVSIFIIIAIYICLKRKYWFW